MIIDLSLTNEKLYAGCAIENAAGRLNLVTPPSEAIPVILQNLRSMLKEDTDRTSVTLTGPMAVWCYLTVFHEVVHRFTSVYYHDGKGQPLLVAKHG